MGVVKNPWEPVQAYSNTLTPRLRHDVHPADLGRRRVELRGLISQRTSIRSKDAD